MRLSAIPWCWTRHPKKPPFDMTPIEALKELVDRADKEGKIVKIFHLDQTGYVVNVGHWDGVHHKLEEAIANCYDQWIVGLPPDTMPDD